MPVSWDLAELEHAAPAAAARGPPCRPECSVDLKLGGLGEFWAADGAMKQPAAANGPAVVVPSASRLRRPRPGAGGCVGHCPSCSVDDCKVDLSMCRDYHRRYKVCEAHSKMPLVIVTGREMRFCQQCSRFHLLAEFDEAKRSCRKRLHEHNRRRRKPQVDSMNSGSFMTSQQGTRFACFPAPRPETSWSGITKSEDSNPYYTHQALSNRQNFTGSTSSYSKEGRRFPFLHEGDQMSFNTNTTTLEIPVCQPLLKAVAPPPERSSKMFSDGQPTHKLDSDCALALLSAPANSSSIDVNRMAHPGEHIPSVAQRLIPNLQFGNLSWFACSQATSSVSTAAGFASSQASGGVSTATGFAFPSMESEQLNTALVPSSNDNEMNYHGIYHIGAEGSSDWTSPSLQFSWQ